MAATQESREKFAKSVVQYLRSYKFDGVDIDWEYPGSYREPDLTDNPNDQGTPKADESEKETFPLLLKTLREYLDRAGAEDGKYYQLTVALSASQSVIDFMQPSRFVQYLDFFNLMTYDMHGAWDSSTNHQSALYANSAAPDKLNVDAVVKQYEAYGVPANKLVIGTPFYSRGWKGVAYSKLANGLEGLFSQAQGGANGIWDGGIAGGMNPYYHLVEMEQDPSFKKYFDPEAQATYLYSEEKGEFYTYEDKRSLQAKVDYVKQHALGGMIIWELSADIRDNPEQSLLNVIYQGFYPNGMGEVGTSEGDTDDNATDDNGGSDNNTTETGNDTQNGNETENGSNSDTIPEWSASTIYTGGERVSYGGIIYEAQWWTQGDVPGAEEWGPWKHSDGSATGTTDENGSADSEDTESTADGNSTSGGSDTDVTGDIEAWDASTIYTGGEVVSYEGVIYQAKWWTQGDIPGTQEWGPWEEIDGSADTSGTDQNSTADSENNDGGSETDSGSTDTGTAGTNSTVSLEALQQEEAVLTGTEQMRLVKASIRTLGNEEVEKIQPLRAENPENVKRVESIIDATQWAYLFPMRSEEYTYENFLKAVGKFPAFCGAYEDGRDSDEICRRSLATMFAHFTQETGGHTDGLDVPQWRQGLVYVREMGWDETMRNGYNAECSLDTWQGKRFPCGKFEDGSFKSYFGRGAKQLSYNYNYGPFSEAMTGDVHTLLDHPELVADTWYNLASVVFFFVYPQPPKPSMLHVVDGTWQPNATDKSDGLLLGFGATINIINGGVECGGSSEMAQALNRIAYYKEFASYLGIEIPTDEVLGCANMKQFSSDGAGALPIYWEEDWSWSSESSDGRSYKCQLVNYQTPYSAFKEGDYVKCVEDHFDVTAE